MAKRALPHRLAVAALALAAFSAQATDLMQAWQAAALWRPTVAFNATLGAMNADTTMTGARFSAPGLGQSDGVNFATSWLGLQTGQARLDALSEALIASRARLDATQLGRQVGDRTTLDLLNAQNDASSADLALVQARADVLLNRLRLSALAGELDEARLQQVNASLQR